MVEPEAVSSTGSPAGSSWSHLVNVFFSPAETFRRLKARPVFGLALATLVILAAIVGSVAFSKVTAADFLQSLEASGKTLPDQVRENPERVLMISRWSQGIAAPIMAGIVYILAAAIFHGGFRMLGSEIGFRQSLATALHGLLPLALAALVGTVIALGQETISMEDLRGGAFLVSNLGFLAGETTGKVTRALLTSVDLFSAWCVFLLALGFRIVAGVSKARSWTVVLVIWGAGVALKVLFASFA